MPNLDLFLTNDLYFHCDKGYGDCIVALHVVNKLCEKNPQINAKVFIPVNYREQLAELILDKNIKFVDMPHPRYSIDLWCHAILGDSLYESHHVSKQDSTLSSYFMWSYEIGNYLAKQLPHLQQPFDSIEETILNEPCFAKDVLDENFDYLIINGYPVSPILRMSREEQDKSFAALLKKLNNEGHNVITTVKVDGYRSTQDYNLNLIDIGKLAKRCKNIIGVPNAPFIASVNDESMKTVESFISLLDRVNTNVPYRDMARTFDLNNKFRTVKSLYELI